MSISKVDFIRKSIKIQPRVLKAQLVEALSFFVELFNQLPKRINLRYAHADMSLHSALSMPS